MTIRNAYENILIELNKVQAPAILLDDFIYLFNKGIQQYINKRYNLFEIQQQLTDDLRVLLKSEEITAASGQLVKEPAGVFGDSYRCYLPSDYMHILNCVCKFKSKKTICGTNIHFYGANKLTTNQWPHIINNYYMQPSVQRPYYYIMNVAQDILTKTGPSSISDDIKKENTAQGSESRYGNAINPTMLIKYGTNRDYTLESVTIDYLRAPQYLSLDVELLDNPQDNSLIIEFPDYVVYEIINTIVAMILENTSNPRMQSHTIINQSVPQAVTDK